MRHLDAVRQRVAGCTDEHDRLLPPRFRLKRARAARVADDADVGLPLLDRLDDAIGVEVFETDVGLGVPAHELLHVTAHVVEADGVDRRHAHAARDLVMQRPDRIHQRIVAGDDLPAAVIERLPLAGRRQGPFGPLDEPHAELRLQLPDDLAGGRLRHAVVLGRAGEAPPGDDVAEDRERLEVHVIRRRWPRRTPHPWINKTNAAAMQHSQNE
jgi:hypothetical protein